MGPHRLAVRPAREEALPAMTVVNDGRVRDYPRLLKAMSGALRGLFTAGDEAAALRSSFRDAAYGFAADRSIFLAVVGRDPLSLRSVCARGLTEEHIRACEGGKSLPGISASVIRLALHERRTVLAHDVFAPLDTLTPALGGDYSVLSAPVIDPVRDITVAVLYFQRDRRDDIAYDKTDLAVLEDYAAVIGQAFGYHFEDNRRERALAELLEGRARPDDAPEIVGESADTQALRRELHQVYIPSAEAPNPDPILVVGERGTGKDLVARYIHAYSGRRRGPFVAVNCAEITEDLATARFSGHRRGSFTGAVSDEPGFFRAADKGVLFLDEVGELSLRTQAVLLRTLENRTVVPVGETKEIRVDTLVVLATNRDVPRAVADGLLRADFADRFTTQCIRLPPLRSRPWDVAELARYFLSAHERRMGRKTLGFTAEALRLLTSYSWPGNVRELDRLCSLLVARVRPNSRVDRDLLAASYPNLVDRSGPRPLSDRWEEIPLREALRRFKREVILARLERHEGDVASARTSLGLPKSTFHRYAAELGIKVPEGPDKEGPDKEAPDKGGPEPK